ncbi:MAG: PQQ-binding-like beta-propeller repeat protein, partial [Actinomycetota bacterium]|nr:PQQ-binding-like beta-propeller repeat protein [Actinomycetota bacterium]
GYYWRFNTNEPIHSSPAVFGRAVIFGARDNNLYSLSIQTGEPLWRMTVQGPIDSSPTVAEINTGEAAQVVVFFGSSDGNVYGRDAFQSVARFQWPRPFSTGAAVVSSPLVVDNVVYVGSSNGIFYALDAATGAQIWQFPTEGSILGSAAMAEGVVYVGSTDGKLYALDARTGRLHCSSPTFGAIQATPVVVDDRILIGTGDTNVHELDLDCNLQQSYLTSIPVVSSPAVDNGIMFVAAERRLLAIELGTNENAWEVPFEAGGNIESPPSITQGVVYVGSDDGHLYALDAGSGEELWSFQTGGAVVSSPAIAEGAVFVTSMGGTIYALGPGEPPGP